MEEVKPGGGSGDRLRQVALIAGPLSAAALILFFDLEPGKPAVTRTAAIALWMAIWWITEAIPLAATALLPVVLFPLLGVINGKAVAGQYFNHVVFLFIGGFMVALAMQRWNLHRRIALRILLLFGTSPRRILLGFMVATAFLSMWISNTAATMMMVTIVMAILLELEQGLGKQAVHRFSIGVLLGVAYSASIGGMATLVGTPPNLSFSRIFEIQFPNGPDISFATWFAFAMGISAILLVSAWLLLSFFYMPRKDDLKIDEGLIHKQYDQLGPLSFAEWVVLVDFVALVLLWIFRKDIVIGSKTIPGWERLFPEATFINDGTVAIALALVLFLIPARQKGAAKILDWATASKLPWNIVLLFGGGFALAFALNESGLSVWLGDQLKGAGDLNPYLLLVICCLTITFLTELTSNTATTEMVLPILAALSVSIGLNPLFLMVPVTISCSCAFMMPVATPPNAIIFGTERVRISDMVKAGILLNIVGVIVIVLGMYLLGSTVWDIDLQQMPDWAKS